jgi:hypothetical protein
MNKNSIKRQNQLVLANQLGLGKIYLSDIIFKSENLENDEDFKKLINFIKQELS